MTSAQVLASQAPEAPKADKPSENARTEQCGTPQLPVVVEIKSVPEPTQEEKEAQAAEGREKSKTDRSIVRLTAGLVIGTGVLAGFTFLLWKSTRKLAIDTAQSAKDTVAVLRDTERAYLFVKFPDFPLNGDGESLAVTKGDIAVEIKNLGNTPAEIIQIRGYRVIKKSAPTSLIELEGSDRIIPPGVVGLASGVSYTVPIGYFMTQEERLEIEAGAKRFFIVGRVLYNDMFGQERETSYCRYLQIFGGRAAFVPVFDSPLNRRT